MQPTLPTRYDSGRALVGRHRLQDVELGRAAGRAQAGEHARDRADHDDDHELRARDRERCRSCRPRWRGGTGPSRGTRRRRCPVSVPNTATITASQRTIARTCGRVVPTARRMPSSARPFVDRERERVRDPHQGDDDRQCEQHVDESEGGIDVARGLVDVLGAGQHVGIAVARGDPSRPRARPCVDRDAVARARRSRTGRSTATRARSTSLAASRSCRRARTSRRARRCAVDSVVPSANFTGSAVPSVQSLSSATSFATANSSGASSRIDPSTTSRSSARATCGRRRARTPACCCRRRAPTPVPIPSAAATCGCFADVGRELRAEAAAAEPGRRRPRARPSPSPRRCR